MAVDDFDPGTPALTFLEIADLMHLFSAEQLGELAAGPIEEPKQCRLCNVLDTILPALRDRANKAVKVELDVVDATPLERFAFELHCWHDDLGRSSWFVDHVEPKLFPGEIERAKAEEVHLFGSIQYARCCMIYAMAETELAKRVLAEVR